MRPLFAPPELLPPDPPAAPLELLPKAIVLLRFPPLPEFAPIKPGLSPKTGAAAQ